MPAWLDTLAHFHFLRPWWLLGLLPAALLVWAARRRGDVRRRWREAIAPHLLDALMLGQRRRLALRPVHLTALLLALGTVALAGPSWRQERPPFLDDKAPLAIAVNLSTSMDAVDVTPTRLERAKLKIKALLARRDGGRTAIYAYAGSTHLVLPLTDDASLLQTFADALQTRIMPAPGRDMAQALRVIDADLKREPVPGTILFLTDGVDPAAAAAFRAQADSGRSQPVVLALGTAQGGRCATPPAASSSATARVCSRGWTWRRWSASAMTAACRWRPSRPTATTTWPGCSATCSRISNRCRPATAPAGRMKAGGWCRRSRCWRCCGSARAGPCAGAPACCWRWRWRWPRRPRRARSHPRQPRKPVRYVHGASPTCG
ncbi:vWA domain-containing protein [Cupriavidus taiwanensis]|uniref:vWA domain-containing protein n=1 Tax=Cupriavidus taiwanensis TaxID=164546 RepID=UPI000E1A3D01|nr:VWA domain-containing protein [Cupriavidus taiwanensis]SPA44044.1 hypothetical protein CBM2629_A100242 [Cupriavidus taiwanensis]